MAAPAFAVSGAGLAGAPAPRSGSGGAHRRRLLFCGDRPPYFPRNSLGPARPSPSRAAHSVYAAILHSWCAVGAVRVGGSGRRVAMRPGGASGEVMIPDGESDGMTPPGSNDASLQFESDDLEVVVDISFLP